MGSFQSMEMGLDDGGIFNVSGFAEFCDCKCHVSGGLSEVVVDLVTRSSSENHDLPLAEASL